MPVHPILTFALIDPVGCKAGMDQYDIALVKGMTSSGVKGVIFSNFTNGPEGIECIRIFDNAGKRKLPSAYHTLNGFFKVLLLAKRRKIDWIVVHVFTAGIIDAVFLSLARVLGLRVCGIVHDIESLDEFSPVGIRKKVISRLLQLRVVHNRFSYEELLRLGYICNGDTHTHIIPHVHFIPLFTGNRKLNLQRDQLTELTGRIHPTLRDAVMHGKPIILFFGQIKKPKGLDILLSAFRDIRNEAVLVIAGKTRDESWPRYQKLIEDLDLKSNVIPVIRHISDHERDVLFSVSRAIVLPYTRIYQSGVLMMAMSYPLAVIASDLPPNLDTIVDGRNGLLFRSGDASDLGQKLKRLIRDDELALQCSKNALEFMRLKHDPEAIGKIFAEMLISGTHGN